MRFEPLSENHYRHVAGDHSIWDLVYSDRLASWKVLCDGRMLMTAWPVEEAAHMAAGLYEEREEARHGED